MAGCPVLSGDVSLATLCGGTAYSAAAAAAGPGDRWEGQGQGLKASQQPLLSSPGLNTTPKSWPQLPARV